MKTLSHYILLFLLACFLYSCSNENTPNEVSVEPVTFDSSIVENRLLKVKFIKPEETVSLSTAFYHYFSVNELGEVKSFQDSASFGLDIPVIELKVEQIKSGDLHHVGFTKDGKLFQFFSTPLYGFGYPSRLKNIKEVYAGPRLSGALNSKKELFLWGQQNVVNELGIKYKIRNVKQAALGHSHVVFIDSKDNVQVQGKKSFGLQEVPEFKSDPVKVVSGDNHVLLLDESGKIYCWGSNDSKQCAIPDSLGRIKEIFAKGNLSACITEKNEFFIWGENQTNKILLPSCVDNRDVALGRDYIILPELVYLDCDYSYFKYADTLIQEPLLDTTLSPKHFFVNLSKTNFYQNKLKVINENTSGSSSENDVTFQGLNNDVTIVNENVTFVPGRGKTRYILKGNGNRVVIKYKDITLKGTDEDKTVVIDLDKFNGKSTQWDKYYYVKKKKRVIVEEATEAMAL